MSQRRTSLEETLESPLQTLAVTLRPGTVDQYRSTTRRFLAYLRSAFPQVRRLSQLRRDPHLLGWFRSLCEQQPPLGNESRVHSLCRLRRLLGDLATDGHSIQPGLIRHEDFPPRPRCLPRPLSPHEDQLLQHELRRSDDLLCNTLLLIRATGIRIGECVNLSLDCLREVGPDQWALHVPLGKQHTERLVPADPEVRRILARILVLRASARPSQLAKSRSLLLPRHGGRRALFAVLRSALGRTQE